MEGKSTSRYHPQLLVVAFACWCVSLHSSAEDIVFPGPVHELGRYHSGYFDHSACEVPAYDRYGSRILVTDAKRGLTILDIADPRQPSRIDSLSIPEGYASINSVAVGHGLVAIAVESQKSRQDPGAVFIYNTQLGLIMRVPVGPLPDAMAFTPDGSALVVAIEAEPDVELDASEGSVVAFRGDAEGEIAIIDLADYSLTTVALDALGTPDSVQAFRAEGGILSLMDAKLPGDPIVKSSQDLEPEYVAISPDSRTAVVSLQENNAIAVIDLTTRRLKGVHALGLKDLSPEANAIDPSNRDGGVQINPWPAMAAYCPDSIALFEHGGDLYLVTANEGDSRAFDLRRVKDLRLDLEVFPNASQLQRNEQLGRLEVSVSAGDPDGDGDQDRLVAIGARSFSIFKLTDTGPELVYDSGSDFERITAATLPGHFNSDNDSNNSFDQRSDDSGPEPEGLAITEIGERRYAFIGLERIGGVMVYDITDPAEPVHLQYLNPRRFDVPVQLPDGRSNPEAGDLGPEAMIVIPASQSPTGEPLLVVANEVSGTTTLYRIAPPATPDTSMPSPRTRSSSQVLLHHDDLLANLP